MARGNTPIAPLQPHTGLCHYDDPDLWFRKTGSTRAAAICANCPVITACGQAALDLDVTNGIWAGVELPGNRDATALAQARQRLRAAVERSRHRPPAQRRRALVMREAIHYAATRRQAQELISQAIGIATKEQVKALDGLRTAIDRERHQPPTLCRPDMIIREAVQYAAAREPASA
uniref:Transcriptional regulator WhiB7 n=1 Tax=Mycobacterium riyadhense TaxID=486698 RepID=A0A653EWE4_9MYCO|nr:Transcriptional regulator WhiB7 [Mycobacterium riyadhense]